MDQSEIELTASSRTYELDGEGSAPSSDGSFCGDSEHGSAETDHVEGPGDNDQFNQSGIDGQEMLQPVKQEASMTANPAYLLPGYGHTGPNYPPMPYLQDGSYGYFPGSSQPPRFDSNVAMQPMPQAWAWHTPMNGYTEQGFHGLDHVGFVPNPMYQQGLLNPSPGGHHLQAIDQFNHHSSEERRGSASDDPEDDVPLMLRLQQRATPQPNTGHHEATLNGDNHKEDKVSDNDDHDRESVPHEDPEGSLHAAVAPKSKDNSKAVAPAYHSALKINWKLSEFETTYQVDNDGWATAKVSLPGMVREYLFLAPDFPEDEFRLIQRVFIPAQQARVDDNPRVALLNFHNMAKLVLDVVFLRAQSFGQADDDFDMKIDPLTFDTDEIFLSALDNWRVGQACGRKNFNLIRGVQEFFDVALDIVFFIKDNGLIVKKPRERKVRADKGVKRGVRAAPNELQARKKAKTGVLPPPCPVAPAKKAKTTKSAEKSKGLTTKATAKTASKANTKTKVTKGKVGRPPGKTAKKSLPKGPRGHIKG